MLGLKVSQEKGRPTERQEATQHTTFDLPLFQSIRMNLEFVEEMYGELPPLLVDALYVYPHKSRHSFTIVPQPRLLKNEDYKSDYMIAVVEVKIVSFNESCT